MPMPRLFGVSLSLLIILSAFVGQALVARPAAAAAVTTTSNAELRSGPGYEHPVVATVLAGASLSIDGPPQNEFYPVTVGGQSGWLHGALLDIAKDVIAAPAPEMVAVAAESSVETAATTPVAAWEPQPVAQELPVGDQAPPPTATAVPVDPAATTPVPEQTNLAAASPVPAATVVAQPAPVATGNATVPGGANLFQSPDSSSYVLFWVPAGSTVWRLGEARNGFVNVDYMAMVGWVPADLLAEPAPVTAEIVPESAPTAETVRTPRPGSGFAFTTVELNLRAGPSASEPALDVVPPGTRVTMTGVMENGFHRVDYRGTLGWVASDYLSTPPNPTATPAPETVIDTGNSNAGTDGNRSNGNRNANGNQNPNQNPTPQYTKTYTRDEIVAIIYAAADRYGQDRSDMLRVAECESALDPYAVHPSGSYGLYQFIRSTWKSTPYGGQSMFDPTANANAAAWMWSEGRRSEWVCK